MGRNGHGLSITGAGALSCIHINPMEDSESRDGDSPLFSKAIFQDSKRLLGKFPPSDSVNPLRQSCIELMGHCPAKNNPCENGGTVRPPLRKGCV